MVQIITDQLLIDHLKCRTKSYLHLRGRSGQATDYSALCSRLDARYRASASQWLAAQSATGGVSQFGGSPLQDRATADAIILEATGVADGLEANFDGLQRTPGDSRLGSYHYRPIRFCRHPQPNSAIRLLLAFDALVLGHLQDVRPDIGILLCGPAFKRISVQLRMHLHSLAAALKHLRIQSDSEQEPPLMLNRHCDICEFKQLCRAKAVEADNLTLLSGMTSKEMAHHNSKGIFSVKQLSYTFRSRRPAKRQKQQFHHNFALQALALREKKVHVLGDPILTLPRTQVYLDIEGLPDRRTYYLIGVLIVTGQSRQYHYFWADDESGQITIFAQLAALLAENTDWSVFHYGNYEVNALRQLMSRVPDPCRESLRVILTKCTNVLSILSSHVYFPTTSNSLKEIAGFLGFRWTTVGASGLESVVWREQWQEVPNDVMKAKLLEYNRDDCLALRTVTEFIASITAPEMKGKSEQSNLDEIVYAHDLKSDVSRKHRFGRPEFCLPDFEFVNGCAYFDYQRDKVNVRSGKRLISTDRLRAPRQPLRAKANKYVEIRCKRCPHCNSRQLSEGRALSTRRIDMKFFGGGVKKWVTVYSSWRYRCHKCGKKFRPPEYPQTANRYGDGLANWVVYQNVALGQNVLKIKRCLLEVFKLDVSQPTLHRFKALVARRYEPTNSAIIAGLLRGPSLSIDETEVRLCKEKAHVWVFAGISGAFYEYRESRNGQFLTERLRGFDGVLVSDFFTAYDSIDCPQQKCLIHLIRDMNEDLKANPYDVELKAIAQAFATIVRLIIETVDRYGLSKSRLQKHKSAAIGFVEKVGKQQLSSETATKYRKRIEKYGYRLFTFLDYDCVPWHNNNAEHAIHSFARYRRFADGHFTKESVSDFLAILSVFQTCEYRGSRVLEVLLSGQTNLDLDFRHH
jgi:predicted RecB family nuclease